MQTEFKASVPAVGEIHIHPVDCLEELDSRGRRKACEPGILDSARRHVGAELDDITYHNARNTTVRNIDSLVDDCVRPFVGHALNRSDRSSCSVHAVYELAALGLVSAKAPNVYRAFETAFENSLYGISDGFELVVRRETGDAAKLLRWSADRRREAYELRDVECFR